MRSMKIVGKRLLCIVLAVAMFSFSLQDFEVDTYAAEQEVSVTSQSTEDSQRQVALEGPDITGWKSIQNPACLFSCQGHSSYGVRLQPAR